MMVQTQLLEITVTKWNSIGVETRVLSVNKSDDNTLHNGVVLGGEIFVKHGKWHCI